MHNMQTTTTIIKALRDEMAKAYLYDTLAKLGLTKDRYKVGVTRNEQDND